MNPYELEELSLNAWPAHSGLLYDGWLLRFSGGYSRRANSVNALYGGSLGLGEKIARCAALYAAKGLPTIYKIIEAEGQAELDAALERGGYGREYDTAVRVLDLGKRRPAPPSPALAEKGFSAAWVDGFLACSGTKAADRPALERILGAVAVEVLAVRVLGEDGSVAGTAFGAVENGWVGVFDVAVAPGSRGRGLGRSVMVGLLDAAADAGAKRSYLQVLRGNSIAESLYGSLGYAEAYGYHYRKKA